MIERTVWTEADVLQMINDRLTENLFLDFKDCRSIDKNSESKKNEMGKDVSAFANSAGGVIIYGVTELGHLLTGIDVGYDPNLITKEWIEQILNSRITPKVPGLRIFQVELTTTNPGKVIYVVSVPQSNNAPHMANDNKYYKRYNFESKPMEHYEVQDVSRRLIAPDLDIKLKVTDITDGESPNSVKCTLGGTIINNSPQPAEYSVQKLYIDSRITMISTNGYFLNGSNLLTNINDGEIKLDQYLKNFGVGNSMPIWKGPAFSLSNVRLQLLRNQTYLVGWEVDAPGMTTKKDFYELNTHYGVVKLESIP